MYITPLTLTLSTRVPNFDLPPPSMESSRRERGFLGAPLSAFFLLQICVHLRREVVFNNYRVVT